MRKQGEVSNYKLAKGEKKDDLCPKQAYTPPMYTPPMSLDKLAEVIGYTQANDEICGTHIYPFIIKRSKGQIYANFFSNYAAEIKDGRNTATATAKLDGVTKYCHSDRQREREEAQAAEVYRAVGLVEMDSQ